MRIISIRVEPVAQILAIMYGFFGLGAFVFYALTNASYLTLPFGVIAPLIHLNLDINLGRSTSVAYNLFGCLAAVLSYALTGWLTGAGLTLCFNLIAKMVGGIDTKYFSTRDAAARVRS
jgi:hypothetical protein